MPCDSVISRMASLTFFAFSIGLNCRRNGKTIGWCGNRLNSSIIIPTLVIAYQRSHCTSLSPELFLTFCVGSVWRVHVTFHYHTEIACSTIQKSLALLYRGRLLHLTEVACSTIQKSLALLYRGRLLYYTEVGCSTIQRSLALLYRGRLLYYTEVACFTDSDMSEDWTCNAMSAIHLWLLAQNLVTK